jgi:hypothetical protein
MPRRATARAGDKAAALLLAGFMVGRSGRHNDGPSEPVTCRETVDWINYMVHL